MNYMCAEEHSVYSCNKSKFYLYLHVLASSFPSFGRERFEMTLSSLSFPPLPSHAPRSPPTEATTSTVRLKPTFDGNRGHECLPLNSKLPWWQAGSIKTAIELQQTIQSHFCYSPVYSLKHLPGFVLPALPALC